MSALCEGVDCRQIGALCIISLNIRMTGDTQPPPPPPPARARRVAEGLLPLYMSIRSKRPTGSGVRRRLHLDNFSFSAPIIYGTTYRYSKILPLVFIGLNAVFRIRIFFYWPPGSAFGSVICLSRSGMSRIRNTAS
jgi:hypothetical protein